MEQQPEQQLLAQYATVSKSKVLSNQGDLDPKDRAMPEMLAWCRQQGNVVVLQNGAILCNTPTGRIVQNCKVVMTNRGLTPGRVYPATTELIHMLLENAEEHGSADAATKVVVSAQQQRLRLLVKEALELGASDIHIEVRNDIARIRFRKHGELFLHAEWLPKLAREVVSVAFNKETDHAITHFNPLIPQSASMPLEIDKQQIRLRLASLPAHGGFDVVLRILTIGNDTVFTLEELGYTEEQQKLIQRAVRMPSGAVIVAGPTGSGKTTTLATCMHLVNDDRKVYTIEDPVEKLIYNATQVPVNTDHYDRDFASMARTVLRMDPDVVVFGEMRDEDTAKVMTRAAITGHLVFSTVHTKNATGIITRLTDLGVSNALLSNPNLLVCLVCQRLAPILCDDCCVPAESSAKHQSAMMRWRRVFDDTSALQARGDSSCLSCHGLGISGRRVVSEIIWVDEKGREFIQRQDILGWKRYLQENGWRSYRDHLLELVRDGLCDPLDAENMVGLIDGQDDVEEFNYSTM